MGKRRSWIEVVKKLFASDDKSKKEKVNSAGLLTLGQIRTLRHAVIQIPEAEEETMVFHKDPIQASNHHAWGLIQEGEVDEGC